jgi:hypothetical protein
MAKIAFRKIRMNKTNKIRLALINEIIEDYQAQGYVLTLRQLYYQLVSRDVIPNKQIEYRKLSILLKEGRMAGIVDWDAIEDRLRKPSVPPSWNNPKDILTACISQYACPRQAGQEHYLEVWVEKDALSGVLSRITKEYHIPILVCRGYSSASAMFDSFERFKKAHKAGQAIKLLYVGDFDPSGEDMVRDIEDRIMEFANGIGIDLDFNINKIALTSKQIQQYNPPPNPAKMSDPRAANFVNLHGSQSWEVDALKPEVLNKLLNDNIKKLIDIDIYYEILKKENLDKKKLSKLAAQLK